MRWLAVFSCVALSFYACGGKAVIDPGADASGGASSSSSSGDTSSGDTSSGDTSSGDTSSSSSGTQQECDRINECCDIICEAVEGLPCWEAGSECECGGAGMGPPGCRQAMRDLFQCMVSELPDSIGCNGSDVAIRCGVCEDIIASMPPQCGIDIEDCAP